MASRLTSDNLPFVNTITSIINTRFVQSILIAFGCLISWTVLVAVYRLYFHRLAKIPGPKLAAVSIWYGFYYDCIQGGQLVSKTEELHKKYGPIIRIRPNLLHMNDPEFIDQIYAGTTKRRDKPKAMCDTLAVTGSILVTQHHELHRRRRAALNPFFSKQSVRRLEPIIHGEIERAIEVLDRHAKTGEPVSASLIYQAMTSDIIHKYSFGSTESSFDQPDLDERIFNGFRKGEKAVHSTFYFPFIPRVARVLPLPVLRIVFPDFRVYKDLIEKLENKIDEVRSTIDDPDAPPTIFHSLLTGDLPTSEKVTERIRAEGHVLLQAGTDTSAFALAAITYHLLVNPDKLQKLRAELKAALPDSRSLPTINQVDTLPYLNAVIQEGLRLHPPASLRQERAAPDEDLFYDDKNGHKYTIPKGTAIAMSAAILKNNEEIYPSHTEFQPERFLENPRLDRYALTFSRGSRGCLGINLAYQELKLVLAALFSKYDLYDGTGMQKGPTWELFQTTRERDVDMAADFVNAARSPESRGVRILVRG